MKIIVATIGSRGDVQPHIALCQGLLKAGHDTSLATNPTLCPLAEQYSVKSLPVGPAVDMGLEGTRLMEQSFNNMTIGLVRVMQLGARLVEQAYPDVLRVCQDADLVIVSDTGSGIAEAEKLGIPWISVTLQPGRVPVENARLSPVTKMIWAVLGKLMILPVNRFRKRVGAPPATDIASMQSKRMLILPVSRYVAPPDPGWPGYVRQTNYWYAQTLENWSPPHNLLEFLEAGEKPLAVSLGVMGLYGKRAAESAGIIRKAIDECGVRAILQGWETQRETPRSESVYFAGSLPHSWLFERVSAVVHHGGFGTTAAVLRAGVPEIVIPHVIDQFYWAKQVVGLGVGPKYIPRGKLNVTNLSEAIMRTRQDEGMREKASELGRKIRSDEDGVETAVRLVEAVLS